MTVHTLKTQLESLRLRAIKDMAASADATPPAEHLRLLSDVQSALIAVREVIADHTPKTGTGSEAPIP